MFDDRLCNILFAAYTSRSLALLSSKFFNFLKGGDFEMMDTANTFTPAGDSTYPREPLRLQGVLDEFKQFDVTPIAGTEFPDAKLVDWMEASNSDTLLRDLAITSLVTRSKHEQQDAPTKCLHTEFPQSLNVASSSSAPRTNSRTISKNSLPSASAS